MLCEGVLNATIIVIGHGIGYLNSILEEAFCFSLCVFKKGMNPSILLLL